jgi:P-type Cu+ transporter
VLTLVGWLVLSGDVTRALTSAIAVIIVACPCAMGLAVPAAIAVAVGRSARLGVLWRDASALERAATVNTVVLDKTGTLTFGKPRVVRVSVLGPDVNEARAFAAAAAVEASSEHPLARALIDESKRRALAPVVGADVVATVGGGIAGTVEGAHVLVGSARFLQERGVEVTPDPSATLYVALDGKPALAIEIDDAVRPSSAPGIARLKQMGVQVWMLSGDSKARAQAVAASLGIEHVIGEARPQDKLDTIAKLVAEGRKVAMVGDGVNDAPALARAHVGFAMRGGTDVALEAADVSVSGAGAAQVALALELARASVRVMKQNLFWAFAYNVVAIPLAAGLMLPLFGIALSPVVASAAMAMSSVSVVTNSLRLALAGKPTPSQDAQERAV